MIASAKQIYPIEKQGKSRFDNKIKMLKTMASEFPSPLSHLARERASGQSSLIDLFDADSSSFVSKVPSKNSHIDLISPHKVFDRDIFTPIKNSRSPTPEYLEGLHFEENPESSTRMRPKSNLQPEAISNLRRKLQIHIQKPHGEDLLFEDIENNSVASKDTVRNSVSEHRSFHFDDSPGLYFRRNSRFVIHNLLAVPEPETLAGDDLKFIKHEERRPSIADSLKDFVQIEPLTKFLNNNSQKTSLFAPNRKPQHDLSDSEENSQDDP